MGFRGHFDSDALQCLGQFIYSSFLSGRVVDKSVQGQG
jgi:hypothetical protein